MLTRAAFVLGACRPHWTPAAWTSPSASTVCATNDFTDSGSVNVEGEGYRLATVGAGFLPTSSANLSMRRGPQGDRKPAPASSVAVSRRRLTMRAGDDGESAGQEVRSVYFRPPLIGRYNPRTLLNGRARRCRRRLRSCGSDAAARPGATRFHPGQVSPQTEVGTVAETD